MRSHVGRRPCSRPSRCGPGRQARVGGSLAYSCLVVGRQATWRPRFRPAAFLGCWRTLTAPAGGTQASPGSAITVWLVAGFDDQTTDNHPARGIRLRPIRAGRMESLRPQSIARSNISGSRRFPRHHSSARHRMRSRTRASPFVARQGTFGLGLDAAPAVGHVGRQLFAGRHLAGRVAFARGLAESLPCGSDAFDLIICRLALPYTRNSQALAEMARVLRPEGLILLKYHHARFYLAGLKRAIAAADIHAMLHTMRVLIAGTVYLLTGRQPNNRILGSECFQTESRIARELSRHGLVIRNATSDSTPRTPSLVVIKAPGATSRVRNTSIMKRSTLASVCHYQPLAAFPSAAHQTISSFLEQPCKSTPSRTSKTHPLAIP